MHYALNAPVPQHIYGTQHKCFHILKCFDGSGQIAAMPNNRIVWHAEQQDLDNPNDTAFTE
jgi:hypothetical protein